MRMVYGSGYLCLDLIDEGRRKFYFWRVFLLKFGFFLFLLEIFVNIKYLLYSNNI